MNVNIGADMLRKSAGIIEERQKVYGPPNKNFKNIARMMNAWLIARYGEIATVQFDEIDVVMFNDCQKSCRLAETPKHEDGWVDKAGYAACGRQVTSDVGNTEPVPVEMETTGPLVGERTEPHVPGRVYGNHEWHCSIDIGPDYKCDRELSKQENKVK